MQCIKLFKKKVVILKWFLCSGWVYLIVNGVLPESSMIVIRRVLSRRSRQPQNTRTTVTTNIKMKVATFNQILNPGEAWVIPGWVRNAIRVATLMASAITVRSVASKDRSIDRTTNPTRSFRIQKEETSAKKNDHRADRLKCKSTADRQLGYWAVGVTKVAWRASHRATLTRPPKTKLYLRYFPIVILSGCYNRENGYGRYGNRRQNAENKCAKDANKNKKAEKWMRRFHRRMAK